MAEVSWLSDYVSAGERSADRLGAGVGHGFEARGYEPRGYEARGYEARGYEDYGVVSHGFADRSSDYGFAGLLGFGAEVDPESWQERALCAQTDPEAFFPEKGGSTREAKKICSSCPVRAECLEYALANDERFGIWGGLSERERRRLRRRAG